MPVTYRQIVTGAAGLVSIAAAAALFGLKDVPRPAWSNEVERVAGDLTELDSRVTSQQLRDARTQYFENQRDQEVRQNEGQPIPDWLLEEEAILEGEIDELEFRLEQLRGQSS